MSRSLCAATAALLLFLAASIADAQATSAVRLCSREQAQEALPLSAPAQRLFEQVTRAARTSVSGGRAAPVQGYCVAGDIILFGAEELSDEDSAGSPGQALATGRIAYALAAWLMHKSRTPGRREAQIAGRTGCLLGTLGVSGDDLTTQLLELLSWSGTELTAPQWTRAALGGHRACRPN